MVLFWFIPIAPLLLLLRQKILFKVGICSLLILWGLVLINYLEPYYHEAAPKMIPLLKGYIFSAPSILITLGCSIILMRSWGTRSVWLETKNDYIGTQKRDFDFFLAIIPIIPLLNIPLILMSRPNQYTYIITLAPTILGLLYLSLEISWTSSSSLKSYYTGLFPTLFNSTRIYKYWKILLIFSFFKSIIDEYQYRGNWWLWGETLIIFLIFNFLLYKFMKLLFKSDSAIETTKLCLPSWKNKRTIIFSVLLFVIVLYVSILSDLNG
jgi:hypothetical protein